MDKALNPKKIVVIDLAFIGDVVLATPVLRSLRERYPNAYIAMLTVPLTGEIARMNPYVDEVLVYDKRNVHKGIGGMFRVAAILRQHRFDMAVCMNFAVRGAVVAWLARIPVRAGYDAQHAGWFLTHVTSSIRPCIQQERLNHLEVLKALAIQPAVDNSLELHVPIGAIQSMHKKVSRSQKQRPLLAICPYGSYQRKDIPEDTLQELLVVLLADYEVYLLGDKKAEEKFWQLAKTTGMSRDHLLAGTLTLTELAAFLQETDCLLSVDTGPQHIAQAVGCPVVALFGPTDPRVWGPAASADIVLYDACDCSPCWGKGECRENICMQNLEARAIEAAIHQRLQAVGKS